MSEARRLPVLHRNHEKIVCERQGPFCWTACIMTQVCIAFDRPAENDPRWKWENTFPGKRRHQGASGNHFTDVKVYGFTEARALQKLRRLHARQLKTPPRTEHPV